MTSIITISTGMNSTLRHHHANNDKQKKLFSCYPEKPHFSQQLLNNQSTTSATGATHSPKNSSKNRRTKSRRVRFQAETEHNIAHVPRWRDLPSEQHAQIWWTADEMDDIKREWKYVVYRIEQGGERVPRGLEQHTEEGAWQYHSAQRRARNVVLEEQDNRSCHETIAEAYRDEALAYVERAVERGKQDAKYAKQYRLSKQDALHLLKEASKTKTRHNKKKKKKRSEGKSRRSERQQ